LRGAKRGIVELSFGVLAERGAQLLRPQQAADDLGAKWRRCHCCRLETTIISGISGISGRELGGVHPSGETAKPRTAG